jgi:hypothetical protein
VTAFALPLLFWLAASPEQRAVDYLAREVPRWAAENHCYSCHNNGDGARALFAAARLGYAVPKAALADTIGWLSNPAQWEKPGGTPGFNDATLARVQFAAALEEAALADRRALHDAAESLAKIQEKDGSWRVETGGLAGAPATYGVALSTWIARRTLTAGDPVRFRGAIDRATAWFRTAAPANNVDAAAIVLAVRRRDCVERLVASQTSDGGWGPQPRTPAEAFDTALAMLALDAAGEHAPIARARALLLRMQNGDGGWPETTRPAGNISYAEHISTTAWALYALVTSRHSER